MKEAAKKLDFEEAANLRDRVKQLRQKMAGPPDRCIYCWRWIGALCLATSPHVLPVASAVRIRGLGDAG